MFILGINAYHGDASATIIEDGRLIAAVEEERFNRIKHSAGFPYRAVKFCLEEASIKPEEIDHIAISRNPNANLHRKILFALSKHPDFNAIKDRLVYRARIGDIKQELCRALEVDPSKIRAKIHYIEHHRAHCASSFLVSGFEQAAILSVDGSGDFLSTMLAEGVGNEIRVLGQVEFPHSLGILYTAVTQYLGFPKYGDEGKVMGLAPYGEPAYLDKFREIVRLKENGRFELDLDYFLHHRQGVTMTWEEPEPSLEPIYSPKFVAEFGPPRKPRSELTRHYKDMAASLQAILEEGVFHLLNYLYERTGQKNLCLAGGVAFNSVLNGKVLAMTPFEDLFIQPAAGDGGTSLGAAFYVYHTLLGKPRNFTMTHAYTGPEFSNGRIKNVLDDYGLKYEFYDDEEMAWLGAKIVAEGKILGWFQGRLEFGPRALGNRSIIADPRRNEMKDVLNSRIKHRESFRPFAPSILAEAVGDYFERTEPDPFMLRVYEIKKDKRPLIPAVTHVDNTGRLQTVHRETNPRYWQLIKEFEKLTGVPVVLNTSFNENEPIVCTPQEAVECFLRTKMDCLVMGNYLVSKSE